MTEESSISCLINIQKSKKSDSYRHIASIISWKCATNIPARLDYILNWGIVVTTWGIWLVSTVLLYYNWNIYTYNTYNTFHITEIEIICVPKIFKGGSPFCILFAAFLARFINLSVCPLNFHNFLMSFMLAT